VIIRSPGVNAEEIDIVAFFPSEIKRQLRICCNLMSEFALRNELVTHFVRYDDGTTGRGSLPEHTWCVPLTARQPLGIRSCDSLEVYLHAHACTFIGLPELAGLLFNVFFCSVNVIVTFYRKWTS
jgi:hypothetical protein